MSKKWTFLGNGNSCPNCKGNTAYLWNEAEDDVIERCSTCGKIWKPSRTKVSVRCSCGCGHIDFSEVLDINWVVLRGKCKCYGGNVLTHTIEKMSD